MEVPNGDFGLNLINQNLAPLPQSIVATEFGVCRFSAGNCCSAQNRSCVTKGKRQSRLGRQRDPPLGACVLEVAMVRRLMGGPGKGRIWENCIFYG